MLATSTILSLGFRTFSVDKTGRETEHGQSAGPKPAQQHPQRHLHRLMSIPLDVAVLRFCGRACSPTPLLFFNPLCDYQPLKPPSSPLGML